MIFPPSWEEHTKYPSHKGMTGHQGSYSNGLLKKTDPGRPETVPEADL